MKFPAKYKTLRQFQDDIDWENRWVYNIFWVNFILMLMFEICETLETTVRICVHARCKIGISKAFLFFCKKIFADQSAGGTSDIVGRRKAFSVSLTSWQGPFPNVTNHERHLGSQQTPSRIRYCLANIQGPLCYYSLYRIKYENIKWARSSLLNTAIEFTHLF